MGNSGLGTQQEGRFWGGNDPPYLPQAAHGSPQLWGEEEDSNGVPEGEEPIPLEAADGGRGQRGGWHLDVSRPSGLGLQEAVRRRLLWGPAWWRGSGQMFSPGIEGRDSGRELSRGRGLNLEKGLSKVAIKEYWPDIKPWDKEEEWQDMLRSVSRLIVEGSPWLGCTHRIIRKRKGKWSD